MLNTSLKESLWSIDIFRYDSIYKGNKLGRMNASAWKRESVKEARNYGDRIATNYSAAELENLLTVAISVCENVIIISLMID